MIAFIAYVSMVSVLLVAAATASEPVLRAIRQPTRSVWLGALLSAVVVALIAVVGPHPTAGAAARLLDAQDVHETGTMAIEPSPARRVELQARPSGIPSAPAREASRARGRTATIPPRAVLAAAGAWLVASFSCVVWLFAAAWRVDQLRRSCRAGWLRGERVLVSDNAGPAVVGVLRYRIVIPSWVEELDGNSQRLILAHGREHVCARDPLALHAALLLVALMPWNIALWFALHRLRAAIEIDCDTRVLRAGSSPTKDYCRLLVKVAERAIDSSSPLLALATPVTLLERRIESMLSSRRLWERRTLVPAAGALVLLAGACRTPRPEIGPAEWRGQMAGALRSAMRAQTEGSSSRAIAGPPSERHQVHPAPTRPTASNTVASTRSSRTAVIAPTRTAAAGSTQATDSTVRNEAALRRSAAEHQPHIDAIADSVILATYPELTRRPPGTPAFLALVLDDRERVIRHAISLDASLPNDLAAIMLALHVDTISARTLGLGISDNARWNVTVGHAVEALGQVRGRTEMHAYMTSPRPYSLYRVPYQRLVDSVARARNPEAYLDHEGTFVIAMLLDEAGNVTRYGTEPHADGTAESRPMTEVMSRLVGDSGRTGDIGGVAVRLRPARTVIVWRARR